MKERRGSKLKKNIYTRGTRYLLAAAVVGFLGIGNLNAMSEADQLKKDLTSEVKQTEKLKYQLDSSVKRNAELKKEKQEVETRIESNDKEIADLKSSVESKTKEVNKLLNQQELVSQQAQADSEEVVETQGSTSKNTETHKYIQQNDDVYSMEATAYDGFGMGGLTATGVIISSTSDKVIAVDPNVIPLGSRVYVEGYGEAIAADTGGDIVGNRIDLNMSEREAIQFGRRTVQLAILN